MRKAVLQVLCLCFLGLPLTGQEVAPEIRLSSLPQNVDELLAMRQQLGTSPSGAVALFVSGLMAYAEDPIRGLPMLIVMLVNDNSLLEQAPEDRGYRNFDLTRSTRYLVDRVKDAPWIPRSYAGGTTPLNGYALPPPPYIFTLSSNTYSVVSPVEVRIFISSTGADSPRPLRLKRNETGLWKVAEFSSLVVGVRPPAAAQADDL